MPVYLPPRGSIWVRTLFYGSARVRSTDQCQFFKDLFPVDISGGISHGTDRQIDK